ncbi:MULTISPECIES: hypothetical protein [Streptomyces]|uniref:Uncharacterized protein n=1 Tax=Streptomyces hokutonensis TaxID=1306990 RepID=A0ABW6M9H8_9ACTN|nr:hypothetical protein OG504_39265 [Streptomyces sp. NBC_00986]
MNNADAAAPERNPFLEAVGRVTVAGAHLDRSLHSLLGSIAFEPTLLVYANAANTDQLIDFCRLALTVSTMADAEAGEITACLNQAKALKNKRNTIVHAIFMSAGEGDGYEAMKPARKTLGHSVTPLTIEDMETVAQQIEELRHELFRLGWNARCARSGMPLMPPRGESA